MGGILRKPWKMGPLQVCMYVACQSFLPSAFLALGIHHQIFPKQSGGSPRSVWTPVCVRARVYTRLPVCLCAVCKYACLHWQAGGDGGRGPRRLRLRSPPSEPPAPAQEDEAAWPFDQDPMLCLVQGLFLILFHFIEPLPSPPPILESGLRIIGSFSSLIGFSDLCSRNRNIPMEQKRKGRKGRERGQPPEGRVHGEGLGSSHILQKRGKSGGSCLVPKKGKPLAYGGWPLKTRLRTSPCSPTSTRD